MIELEKQILNLTPHDIDLYNGDVKVKTYVAYYTKEQQHMVPRCVPKSVHIGNINGTVPIYTTVYGEVNNLPDMVEDTMLIVSALVRLKHPERIDLLSPYGLIRDEAQRIIGCSGFDTNYTDEID